MGIAIIYAFLTALVLWALGKFLLKPEAFTVPLSLAIGMGIGGAIFEFFAPTSKEFGIWNALGEALGTAIGFAIVCTAPTIEFVYAFMALAVFAYIGQHLRVWRLKRRGYTLADS